jgi:hypothetical protein
MGNAGDLLKHGVLAEFVRWHCGLGLGGRPFRFLDPFAGESSEKVKDAVCRRIASLNSGGDFALPRAQTEIDKKRYYGSSMLVKRVVENEGGKAEIRVSDGDERRRRKLAAERGFREISAPGFIPEWGYSALRCINKGELNSDLVLIDPFADFLPCEAERVTPFLAEASKHLAVVLFVLNKKPNSPVGQKWECLKKEYLPCRLVLSCPPLKNIPSADIHGESDFYVEVLLLSPLLQDTRAKALRDNLGAYAAQLRKTLNAKVKFAANGVE